MNSFCDWTEVELLAFQVVHRIMRESGTQSVVRGVFYGSLVAFLRVEVSLEGSVRVDGEKLKRDQQSFNLL